jgi:hypothetical protein
MLFELAHLSVVADLRLTDGREVVVKARPPADRIRGSVHVQRHLWSAGFPCPEPLAGPAPMGALTATTEAFVPWSLEEREICWAAGLWTRAYNTKKDALDGNRSALLEWVAGEATERLRLAGAQWEEPARRQLTRHCGLGCIAFPLRSDSRALRLTSE